MKTLILVNMVVVMGLISCTSEPKPLQAEVYETSASGHKLTRITDFDAYTTRSIVTIDTAETFQAITGFGGSFTEASASLLNRLGSENRKKIIEAYFGDSGAKYSLTRTHINSSDFSLGHYSYAPVAGDNNLQHFSVAEDEDDIIPMILEAQKVSTEGFKIVASPWTAPPWMKDNNAWEGGRLRREHYETWALFLNKYLSAYREKGIDIWALTVENEPLGNDNNWESMLYTPKEMNDFVIHYLGPLLRTSAPEVKILGFDQNREELRTWVDAMYGDTLTASYYDGTAIHWYASTYDYFPEELQYAHHKAPGKHLIQTEACVDAEVPRWMDDLWYWSEEATDWGYDWAPEDLKYLHPKYIPAYRYARDIIGCLNNWVDGWIDWNMVLDRQGGPNLASNWCVAPVIVDPVNDEVYFTPLYYVMAQFSRFIRPGAVRIGHSTTDNELMVTALHNPDGTIVVVIFNPGKQAKGIRLIHGVETLDLSVQGQALYTVVLPVAEEVKDTKDRK